MEIREIFIATKRKLAFGKKLNVPTERRAGYKYAHMDDILKVAERFYTRRFASDFILGENTLSRILALRMFRYNEEGVGKVLKSLKR